MHKHGPFPAFCRLFCPDTGPYRVEGGIFEDDALLCVEQVERRHGLEVVQKSVAYGSAVVGHGPRPGKAAAAFPPCLLAVLGVNGQQGAASGFEGLLQEFVREHALRHLGARAAFCEKTKKQMEGFVRQAGLAIPVRCDAGYKVFFPAEEEGRRARDFFPISAPSDACDVDEAIDEMMRRQSRFLALSSCTDVEEAADLALKYD